MDFRDVAQPQALVADDQVADLLNTAELALWTDPVACLIVADQTGGIGEINLVQPALQVDQVDAVRSDAVRDEFDADFMRLHPLQIDAGHARYALEGPDQLAHQHVVGIRKVAFTDMRSRSTG